jgi:regulatory protein
MAELEARLSAAGFGPASVAEAVAGLARERLVDDGRYAEHFVAYHAARGHGPVLIAHRLREAGVSAELIAGAVDARDPAWRQRCAGVRRRRFGAGLPGDWKERARQARFLAQRGFAADQVRAAVGGDEDGD